MEVSRVKNVHFWKFDLCWTEFQKWKIWGTFGNCLFLNFWDKSQKWFWWKFTPFFPSATKLGNVKIFHFWNWMCSPNTQRKSFTMLSLWCTDSQRKLLGRKQCSHWHEKWRESVCLIFIYFFAILPSPNRKHCNIVGGFSCYKVKEYSEEPLLVL